MSQGAATLRGGWRQRRWPRWWTVTVVAVAVLVGTAIGVGVLHRHAVSLPESPPPPPATEAETFVERLGTLCGARGLPPSREADRELVASCLPQEAVVRTGNRPDENAFLLSFCPEGAEIRLPWEAFVSWGESDEYIVVSLQRKRPPGGSFLEIVFFCRSWTPAEEVAKGAVLSGDGTWCDDEVHPMNLVVGVMTPGDPFPGDDKGLYQAIVEVQLAP